MAQKNNTTILTFQRINTPMNLTFLKKRLFYGLVFALLAQVIGITKATAQATTPFKTTWIATATHTGVYIRAIITIWAKSKPAPKLGLINSICVRINDILIYEMVK